MMTPTITSAEQAHSLPYSPTKTAFGAISSEERRAINERANATRRARASTLRSDVAHDGLPAFHSDDRNEWDALAAAAGVKLPPYGVPCTPGKMGRWLARLDIPLDDYLRWAGDKRLGDFRARNPGWGIKAWVGLILEWRGVLPTAEEVQQNNVKM